ncbi:MAG TPA: hypothetical protein VF290_15925 [Pyrinomonadaceae bacterium]
MVNNGSASVRETPHVNAAIKRRAESLINDKLIDGPSRAIIRYGLETDDPWLGELVRRVDAGETIVDNLYVTSDEEQIETLTTLICREGDEPATKASALLVLMATLENSPHPKLLANTAKHFAFNRCGELNLHGMVDAEIKTLAGEFFVS